MGCCNNPNYQSRAARESINRSAYEACQCADRSCECKDLAEQYAQNAEETWNDFQTRYLGAYSVAPVTSTTGALYFNTVSNQMFVWNGTTWTAVPAATIIGDGDKGDITVSGLGSTWTIDNGAVTSAKIADGTIVNGDISNTAAIAGTKISPSFGSQNVTTTGDVGIGTTTPLAKLHVEGDIRASGTNTDYTALQLVNTSGVEIQIGANQNLAGQVSCVTNHPFIISTNNIERVRVASNGDIGVGTSTPAYNTDIVGNSNGIEGARILNQSSLSNAISILQIGNDTNGAAAAILLNSSTNTATSGPNGLSIINGLNAPITLNTNNTERLRIEGDGDVGIGTGSPSSKLHVDGDLTVSSATTANTATAGAQTLPANPVGFLVVSINGTSRKIPYYAI